MSALIAALTVLALAAAAQPPRTGAAAPPAEAAVPAVPAAAAGPAVPPLPDDPATVSRRLRQAVFASKPRFVLPQPTFTYRPDDDQPAARLAPVGHRVVQETPAAPGGAGAGTPPSPLTPGLRVKNQSVQLSLLRAGPGLTAGVGVDETQASFGSFRGPSERAGFLFLRLQLGRQDSGRPGLMLPRARVTSRSGLGPERSDDYSLDDLPGYRGRP